jgi:hypothetical protein
MVDSLNHEEEHEYHRQSGEEIFELKLKQI